MTQNSARNGRVIIRMLNAEPIATKHTMERVVAFDMSFISTRLLDSLIDLYRPQMERMRWQMNNAIRKMMQFNILVLIERNWVREMFPSLWMIIAVVSPKDSTKSTRSRDF